MAQPVAGTVQSTEQLSTAPARRIRRLIPVSVTAIILLTIFAILGALMMPRWQLQPFTDHVTVASPDTAVIPRGVTIRHQGAYRTRESHLTITTADGIRLDAILRQPTDAAGRPLTDPRPACLFIHGSGTGGAGDFGDIAGAMASAGIITLVPAKRLDNYTALHRNYDQFARDYARAFARLLRVPGVNPEETGVYAESEGTWIATLMASRLASQQHPVAFSVLASAPVFTGREQMAMAVSAYAAAAGAPEPMIRDVAKVASLNFAPYGLQYADFDAARYRAALTMPVFVAYGTFDTAMPIEQGAQTLIDAAQAVGNRNVTVRYFPANHQMRAGEGLFTPGLPLADGYTTVLCDWVNSVAAGVGADDWVTPQIAGAAPHQQYAAPDHTDSGIIGSLGWLSGLIAASAGCLAAAGVLGVLIGLVGVARRIRARLVHQLPAAGLPRFPRATAVLLTVTAVLAGAIVLSLSGYVAAVIVQALLGKSHASAFTASWVALQVGAVLCAVSCAWLAVHLWRGLRARFGQRRRLRRGDGGSSRADDSIRRNSDTGDARGTVMPSAGVICVGAPVRDGGLHGVARWTLGALVLVGTLLAMVVMAFWGLFSPVW